jgi:hypothetical protein
MVTDDPQAIVVYNEDELSAIIAGYTRDFIEDSDSFRMSRIRQIDQTNRFSASG